MGEFTENTEIVTSFDVAQLDEITHPFCVLPDPSLDDVNVLADSSYYEEINQH